MTIRPPLRAVCRRRRRRDRRRRAHRRTWRRSSAFHRLRRRRIRFEELTAMRVTRDKLHAVARAAVGKLCGRSPGQSTPHRSCYPPLQNRLTQQVAAASGRAQSACPGSDGCGQLLRCDLGAGLLDKPGSHYEGTTTRVNGRSRRSTPCGLGRLNPRANPNQAF